jgi:hypothetical protein
MDKTKLQGRIDELTQQRMRMAMNIAAIDGAVGELQRLLKETPEPACCGQYEEPVTNSYSVRTDGTRVMS